MIETRCQLAAKAESQAGTAVELAAADVVAVSNVKFNPDVAMGARPIVSSSLSKWASVPGARMAGISFDMDLKGSGTAGTPPAFGKLLKGCGFAETIVGSPATAVQYKPASSGIACLTMGIYNDGIIQKIWGALGEVSCDLENGKPGILHFLFTGIDFSETDGAMLTGVTYESTVPPAFLNASLTIDSYAPLITKLGFGLGNVVSLRDDPGGSASGYKSAVITGRDPSLTFDPESVLAATYDYYAKLKAGNEGALTVTLGATAGNIVTITAPKVQYAAVKDEARKGYKTKGITSQLNRSAGDDEIVITLT